MEENNDVRCPQCGKLLEYGRVDRRFCSVACKNLWHNRLRYPAREKEIKRVLRILNNNRDVLDKLLKLDITNLDRVSLEHLGFNVNYFTSMYRYRNYFVYTCLDIRYELTPTRIRKLSYLGEGVDE